MRFQLPFLCALFLCVGSLQAQFIGQNLQWYIGPHVGAMHYNGDLSKSSVPNMDVVNPGGGIQGYFQYRRWFGLQLSYTVGRLNGSDSLVSDARADRGFDFVTTIHDFSLNGKINLLFHNRHKKNFGQWMWQPRLLLGIGYFRYNPRTQLNGAWIELQEIGTEGQHLSGSADGTEYPDPYRLWALNYRVGGEVSFDIGGKTRGGARYKRRASLDLFFFYVRANTDYLDDVGGGEYPKSADLAYSEHPETLRELSYPQYLQEEEGVTFDTTRGNPDTMDGWFYYGITLSYQIDSRGRRRGGFGPRRF